MPDRGLGAARAQEAGDLEPRGQWTVTYQNQRADDLSTALFTIETAPIRSQAIDFALAYRIQDRWTINAGLPLIARETVAGSHDPRRMIPPRESDFVDDGHFHPYLQDLRLGASYLVTSEPIAFETYLEYGIPVSDYPFFAASGVGRNLQTIEVGTAVGYRPPFLKWHFSLRMGYQMADKVLGYDIDAMRVAMDAAYFVSPRVTLITFLTSKNGKGIDPPRAPDFTSELWYRHDQLVRHNFRNLGVGVDWSLNDRNVLNLSLLKMVHAEDVFKLSRAMSVALSRSF